MKIKLFRSSFEFIIVIVKMRFTTEYDAGVFTKKCFYNTHIFMTVFSIVILVVGIFLMLYDTDVSDHSDIIILVTYNIIYNVLMFVINIKKIYWFMNFMLSTVGIKN
jgi:hypothetical protein